MPSTTLQGYQIKEKEGDEEGKTSFGADRAKKGEKEKEKLAQIALVVQCWRNSRAG